MYVELKKIVNDIICKKNSLLNRSYNYKNAQGYDQEFLSLINPKSGSTNKYFEMDGKRWLARYVLLSAVGAILLVKVYLLTFIDLTIGIYGIIITFILFSYLYCSYFKYKDPYVDSQNIILHQAIRPFVSIIIPVKNEKEHIEKCIRSCSDTTYQNKEVIVVNDCSTDETPLILDKIKREMDIKVIHLPENVGKKKAIQAASKIARGDLFVFTDSDCQMDPYAIENAVKIFQANPKLGGIVGHIREIEPERGGIFRKMMDVRLDNSCRIIKGMESSFSSVSCCSGPLTVYRREAVMPFIDPWANDKFLNKEFKFSTDRRLTAYVLGAINKRENNQSVLWEIKYTQSMRVYCREPETMKSLIKQRIRWHKSFIRSIFATGKIYWKRPFFAALIYYLQLFLKVIRPYIILKALILLPIVGDYFTGIFYISGVLFTGMIYGLDFKLRHPNTGMQFLYRPLVQLITIFILTWLLLYAAITIRKMNWR